MKIVKKKERLKKGEIRKINWETLVADLTKNCNQYHHYFYTYNKFTGPSIHFHTRALTSTGTEKSEMTYAMLVAWGMHRMGSNGAKMNSYEDFNDSISLNLKEINLLKSKKLDNVTEIDMNKLEKIFNSLNPMLTKKKVVAVSKILAHYLPNIIAPIDNEYTFQFICQKPKNTNPPRNWKEFDLFKEIHLQLFKKVILNKKFNSKAKKWINNPNYPWDTSLPKIVDNLIVGKISHLKKTDKKYKKLKKTSPIL